MLCLFFAFFSHSGVIECNYYSLTLCLKWCCCVFGAIHSCEHSVFVLGCFCSQLDIYYSKSSLISSVIRADDSSLAAAFPPYSRIRWMSKVNTCDGSVCWSTCCQGENWMFNWMHGFGWTEMIYLNRNLFSLVKVGLADRTQQLHWLNEWHLVRCHRWKWVLRQPESLAGRICRRKKKKTKNIIN